MQLRVEISSDLRFLRILIRTSTGRKQIEGSRGSNFHFRDETDHARNAELEEWIDASHVFSP